MKRWRRGFETAKQTIKATTQRGIRNVANPSLSRRFRTNDRQMRYNKLNANIFTDTLYAKTKSFRGNKYAQAYGTDFKWARVHAMESKSDAHKTLKYLFARDGIPASIFCDNADEQTSGHFRKTCIESGVYLKSTEPYSTSSNAAESTIRDVEQGSTRKIHAT